MAIETLADTYRNFLAAWVSWSVRHARFTAIVTLIMTAAALGYFIDNLQINTSTTNMLSKDLPFRQHARAIDQAFPQMDNTFVVVIEGQTADIADDAALVLGTALRKRSKQFADVYDLKGDPFFRRNGLLYLDMGELHDLSARLAGAQPFLATLWRDSSLRGFFAMLGLAVEEAIRSDAPGPLKLTAAFNAIADVADAQQAGRFHLLSWTKLMGAADDTVADRRRFIIVKPALDYGSLQPASDAIDMVRKLSAELGLTRERGLRVRLTGSVVLDEEELESVETGMGLAAIISLTLVLFLLVVGLRSLPLVLASLGTLLAGLVWTAAFAILAIGALNLISVAFAVLFIGLSVDFGIHFALRYREELWRGYDQHDALAEAARGVGGALSLCALSAAFAFYAFLPTDYVGLAELGLIAGTGMFIAFFSNVTVLPALIALWPLPNGMRTGRPVLTIPRIDLSALIRRHAKAFCWLAVASGVGAALMLPRVTFDFDPLNLKNPNTESVATLLDLMRDGGRNNYTIDILAPNLTEAEAIAKRLGKLDLVDKTVTLKSYVPTNQTAKLGVILNLALFISPALNLSGETMPVGADDRMRAWADLKPKLTALAETGKSELGVAAGRMVSAISVLVEKQKSAIALLEIENRLLAGLPGRLEALQQSLEADEVKIGSLPDQLRKRNVAADGRAIITVYPKEIIDDRATLERFVEAVRDVAPDAVGSPVVILEAGRTVLRAFGEACIIAVICIVIMLAYVLRRGRDIALVFAPLILSALWTMAAATLLGLAFNLANVIVLPLLFGLGVAGAIHLVVRARDGIGAAGAMETSTPRAVLFSALTTIGSFGSISLSAHPGTSSMGMLLTIAITMTLVSTLVFLPALIEVLKREA